LKPNGRREDYPDGDGDGDGEGDGDGDGEDECSPRSASIRGPTSPLTGPLGDRRQPLVMLPSER
jgi:hypothetical protein